MIERMIIWGCGFRALGTVKTIKLMRCDVSSSLNQCSSSRVNMVSGGNI